MRIKYYLKLWLLLTKISFLAVLSQRGALLIFLFGKVIRFSLYFAFLYFLLNGTKQLAGYSLNQVLFFLLTFNLIDIVSQFLFREVYRFRPQVVSGSFDLVLTKPLSSLFRSLMSGADVIDFITIPPLVVIILIIGQSLSPNFFEVLLYILLVFNGLLIATAFHIAVLAMSIITLEIDYTIMIYRDLVALGRFPVDIYKEPLKGILTFIVPVALMITIPAKVLMGRESPPFIFLALALGFGLFFASLKFWKHALRYYTSASN